MYTVKSLLNFVETFARTWQACCVGKTSMRRVSQSIIDERQRQQRQRQSNKTIRFYKIINRYHHIVFFFIGICPI